MPFEPNVLEFRFNDTKKLVRFYDASDGPAPWTIQSAKIDASYVETWRWKFEDVRPVVGDSTRMQGTLRFDRTNLNPDLNLSPGDRWLLYRWPTSGSAVATLELYVLCNNYYRPLSVALKA